ncbi:MAG TPA: hypothetical protein VJN01_09175, partial [Xanthomonadales bacterium]|nr:hypothetical protein [Xanthomonadales bacterium]
LGGMFLVLIHHLFDASWSVATRRIAEHLAFLLPVMAVLFIPIAILAPNNLYPWLVEFLKVGPHADHALAAKQPIFSVTWFYIIAVVLFAVWTWLTWNLRRWSLRQDQTGEALCTHKLRKYSAAGIYIFAFSLTLAAIMWVKSLEHQWFSTMYGVYYFAGSVWVSISTVYVITMLLQRTGPLSRVVGPRQFHDLGVLLFAFTVFYAYIAFSQYFLIWNAAMPEETFWYVKREQGTWWQIGMLLIFGHFALPFLTLLRIDAKLWLPVMIPLCAWNWLMHFVDMSFNIMPVLHDKNFVLHWADIGCMAFIGGVLSMVFLKYYFSNPPYPLKDPRLAESLGVHHHAGDTSVAPPQEKARPA